MSTYTPEEGAAYDDAFDAGLRKAWERDSGLILAATRVSGVAVWIAAYPKGNLSRVQATEWAHGQGIQFSKDDLYLLPAKVREIYGLSG